MRYKSCPHTKENLYDSTWFAQTKFSKITVSDRFLSAVMYVHTYTGVPELADQTYSAFSLVITESNSV
jgi:hypothetical protein